MSRFRLDPRLAADTVPVCDLALCAVRLMNDRRFAWLVLVPRVEGAVELADLEADGMRRLGEEILAASAAVAAVASPHKLNVGALGNIVRQLHVHVVGRTVGDPAWPGPVWGSGPAEPYDPADLTGLAARYRTRLAPTP